MRAHTHTPSHTPSSPGAGCTWSLTVVQGTCHIEGVFKKELKESAELRVPRGTAYPSPGLIIEPFQAREAD